MERLFQTRVAGDDGITTLTLGVERGTAYDHDIAPFYNEATNKPVACILKVPTEQADSILQHIQASFSSALDTIYSNRITNEQGQTLRHRRQEYRWNTIKNIFDRAIGDHAAGCEVISSHADQVISDRIAVTVPRQH